MYHRDSPTEREEEHRRDGSAASATRRIRVASWRIGATVLV